MEVDAYEDACDESEECESEEDVEECGADLIEAWNGGDLYDLRGGVGGDDLLTETVDECL